MKTFEGYDKQAGFTYRYDPDTGVLSIGCTDLTIAQWRLQGEARIQDGLSVCNLRDCPICASNVPRRAYARVALAKLLDEIEAAEAPEPIVYNESRPQIVLDADVYDTLELSALAFGGIGAGQLFQEFDEPSVPVCFFGHIYTSEIVEPIALNQDGFDENRVYTVVDRIVEDTLGGLTYGDNDDAVREILSRSDRREGDRVSFAEWVGELNVVRGAE